MSTGSVIADPPKEALDLHEGISILEAAHTPSVTKPDGTVIELGYDGSGNPTPGGVFDAKGRVPLHIIRPGIGKGRGRHLYEANMLRENADVFSGWKMYLNHQSEAAKKAAAGLPRDVRDLGGRVQEAWWDPSVPANRETGHDAGAVMGMVRPVRAIRELIEDDPGLVEASISASATGVRPVQRDGQRVWLVEGINKRGSVDWVTEAGAGGRIAEVLRESYADEEDVQMALLESLTDDELLAHANERGLTLQEAKGKKMDADDDGDAGADDESDPKDELNDKIESLVKKGMPRAMAEKAAKKALSESTDTNPEGGDVAEITPEALKDALTASPTLIVEALTQSAEAQVFLSSLVEAKLEEERDSLRAESKADVDRAFELARLERTAHGMIAESKLPASWQADLRGRFSLDENNDPSPALDVVADISDEGKVEKTADAKLREAVHAEIEKERERLREASQTRVRPSVTPIGEAKSKRGSRKDDAKKKDGEDDGDDPGSVQESREQDGPKPYWAQVLSEAGVQDPNSAYALEG